MIEPFVVIISFLFGALWGAETCAYWSVPRWYRWEHLCIGFIPFVGGFLLKWKWESER